MSSFSRAVWRFVFGEPTPPSPSTPSPSPPPSVPTAEDDTFVVPIEEVLDLHFFARRDLPSVIDEYLRAARLAGLFEVRLVHGRGKGVARAMVEKIVDRSVHAVSRTPAPWSMGGPGALLVRLKPGTPDPDP